MKCFQVKIELDGLGVWRRVLVPEDITFYELKQVVDYTFGWSGYYDYELRIKDNIAFVEDEIRGSNSFFSSRYEFRNSRTSKVFDYVKSRQVVKYLYDFGDEWLHTIKIEKAVEGEAVTSFVCVEGDGDCPVEDWCRIEEEIDDCDLLGDSDYYKELLVNLGVNHPQELKGSLDLDEVNQRLKGLRKKDKS